MPQQDNAAVDLTAAQAAKAVKRSVSILDDKKEAHRKNQGSAGC